MGYHHPVACPCWSVAVSTISRHSSRSYALCLADHSPRFCCLRSFSTVRSQVCRGRPRGRLHSFGGSSMPALRARVWSSSESDRTMWPKYRRRLALIVWVTGGWAERKRTSWLVTCAVKGTCRICRRHHWSNASSRLPDFTVTSHISEPYRRTHQNQILLELNKI